MPSSPREINTASHRHCSSKRSPASASELPVDDFDARGERCRFQVRLDERCAHVVLEVPLLGIDEQHRLAAGPLTEPLEERAAHHPFVVVGDDDTVEPFERTQHAGNDFPRQALVERARLAVETNHLLLVGENAYLADRRIRRPPDDPGDTDADRLKVAGQPPAGRVGADHADDRRLPAERADVGSHVRRAPEVKAFPRHLHDRHGRLRRDAAHPSGDELVEHEVTDHEQARTGKTTNDGDQATHLRHPHSAANSPAQ